MYLLNTEKQERDMLAALGLASSSALYAALPDNLKIDGLDMPSGLSEQGVAAALAGFAAKNTVFKSIFRGAGAYNHYIPAVVPQMANKERFKTAYTPYQPEVSQGMLQGMYEFQSMVCELMGLDVSNASMYDGPTATAEAAAMCRDKRSLVVMPTSLSPTVRQIVSTYSWAADSPVLEVPHKGGRVDLDNLKSSLEGAAAFIVQQPNYFGLIEDVEAIAAIAHEQKVKLVVYSYPIAAAVLKCPGELGADIAVGEGQPLGMPLSFGGPYLGFIAAKSGLLRRMPGRIVGETADSAGRRAFVLTLQAREQHIRRETATSNICSNQALCALTAACYMATMGPAGLREVAEQSYTKAHYLQDELAKIGYKPIYQGDFFNEFVTTAPNGSHATLAKLEACGILGGLALDDGHILWCATEENSKAGIDEMTGVLKDGFDN